MPTPSEYDAARFRMKVHAEDSWNTGNHDDIAHYALALRCLRVVAAMEAGTLRLQPPSFWNAEWEANYAVSRDAMLGVGEGPDPLTAAERAMGMGT